MSSYTYKQLEMAWTAVHGGIAPDAETASALKLMTNASFTDAQALSYILNSVDASTTLAVLSYQFFTGKSPTKDGLAYLTNSAINPNDLNDAYYAKFGQENRYINFAANLGVQGEGAGAFASKYGAMSFGAYVASIYETIIGGGYATAAGIDAAKAIADITSRYAAILATAQSSGMITPGMTQAQIDLAVKAATAGYLMGEAIKADVGLYAGAANNFVLGVALGNAVYNTDITTTYKPDAATGSGGQGQPVNNPPPANTVPGAPPPPAPAPDPVAHSFTLTTSAETFTGENLADTFTGTLGTGATLNAGDALDGADGDDTLTITSNAASSFAFDSSKIKNIEHLRVTATGGAAALDLGGIAFTDVTNTGSTQAVTFTEAAPTSNLKIASTSASTTFETPNTGLGGGADAMTLTLSDVTGAAGVTINDGAGSLNQYETLNIVSNGTANAIKLGTDTHQTSLATINISGAAPLTLTFAAGGDHIVTSARTIDSDTATGGVTIGDLTTALGAANHTVTLGTGRNVVFFGNGVLNTNDTVTATAGTNDTLVITGATGVTSADLGHVTGIETFRFMNNSGLLTQDVTQLPGAVTLEIDGSNSAVLFSNLANNGTVNALNAFSLRMGLAANTGSDALTVNITPATTAGATISTITNVAGLETLNLVSNGATGQTAANVIGTDNVAAAHVLTGSADLTITNALATADLDASAFTGKLTATAQAGGTAFVGGTGADTLNGGAGNDTFQLGAQGANAQSGADTIFTNGGSDTVIFVGNAPNGTGAATSLLGAAAWIRGTSGTPNVSNLTTRFSADDHDFSLKNFAGTTFTGLAKGAVAQGLTAGDTLALATYGNNDGPTAAIANLAFIGLTGMASLNNSGDLKQLLSDAIGNTSITGLAADGNYLVTVFDGGSSNKTLLFVVNVGASGAGDTTLSAADFTDTGVALIGYVSTSAITSGMILGTAF
ncbi:hypothetical protein [Caulobacter segnis]